MNQTIETINKRRSCKAFLDKKVPSDIVNEILNAGTKAPSALNKQSASIICIENEDVLNDLRNKLKDFIGKDPLYGARTIAIVVADKNSRCPVQDGSCVLENMFIAATSLGIDTCWINCLHDYFATEEGNSFKKNVLQLSDDQITIGTCAIGYRSNNEIIEKPRKENYIRII